MGSSPAKRATLPPCGRLAQLVRASALHAEGRGFEPLAAHQSHTYLFSSLGSPGESSEVGAPGLRYRWDFVDYPWRAQPVQQQLSTIQEELLYLIKGHAILHQIRQ